MIMSALFCSRDLCRKCRFVSRMKVFLKCQCYFFFPFAKRLTPTLWPRRLRWFCGSDNTSRLCLTLQQTDPSCFLPITVRELNLQSETKIYQKYVHQKNIWILCRQGMLSQDGAHLYACARRACACVRQVWSQLEGNTGEYVVEWAILILLLPLRHNEIGPEHLAVICWIHLKHHPLSDKGEFFVLIC